MKKRNRGITLIALVITIILLLILVAVSIATLTGDNGILTKANNAKTTNDTAQAEEEMKLLLADWQLEKRANSNADLGDFLNEKLENGELDKVTDNKDGSYTIEKNGYETTISDEDGLGEIAKVEPPKETIFKNVDTTETYPDGSMPTGAKVVEENGKKLDDADEGIVIKDTNDNEWVWIEVPKSEMPKGLKFENEEDYNTLTAKLKEYAYPYTKGAAVENYNWKDEWYDKLGTTYNGIDYYSEVRYIDSETSFNEAKTYYTNIYTDKGTTIATSYESGATYYTKITENLDDTLGCGLTYNDYQETYQKMLRSVYTNGGFWIGRYEAGIEGTTESAEENPKILELGRTKVSARIDEFSPKPISKKDAVPYSFVYCSEAQKLASDMSVSSANVSSLMFGVQWDLVCKFIEEKEVQRQGEEKRADIIASINANGWDWGNFYDGNISITSENVKYYQYDASYALAWRTNDRNNVLGGVLLSCGASDEFEKMNIYDLAGNTEEWTLEHSEVAKYPCSRRGASYYFRVGNEHGVASRRSPENAVQDYSNDTVNCGNMTSFRPCLF